MIRFGFSLHLSQCQTCYYLPVGVYLLSNTFLFLLAVLELSLEFMLDHTSIIHPSKQEIKMVHHLVPSILVAIRALCMVLRMNFICTEGMGGAVMLKFNGTPRK